jgi:signal transduction histidine kinase
MMRRITEELRPTLLDNVGLLAALRWQIKDMSRRLAIQCREHMPDMEPALTPSELISIFRAGQESLLVAENQADATDVDFTLTVNRGLLLFRPLRVRGLGQFVNSIVPFKTPCIGFLDFHRPNCSSDGRGGVHAIAVLCQ